MEAMFGIMSYDESEPNHCNGCSVALTADNTNAEMESYGFDYCNACAPRAKSVFLPYTSSKEERLSLFDAPDTADAPKAPAAIQQELFQ